MYLVLLRCLVGELSLVHDVLLHLREQCFVRWDDSVLPGLGEGRVDLIDLEVVIFPALDLSPASTGREANPGDHHHMAAFQFFLKSSNSS